MTPRESALIVEVPEAEALVGAWRLRFCADAQAGVPAHVTLLYPFVSADDLAGQTVDELERLFAAVRPFEFQLAHVERFPEVLYLAPVPREPFLRVIDTLRRRFPEYPPYGLPDLEVVPHLTVAYGDEDLFASIEPELTPALPVAARVDAASLIEQDAAGRWHRRARLPLGTATGRAV